MWPGAWVLFARLMASVTAVGDFVSTSLHNTDTDHLTIRFEDGADGWVTATIAEEPAAISQGRTREEARRNVLDALRDLHDESTPSDRIAVSAASLYGALVDELRAVVDFVRDRVRQRVA